MKALLLPLLAFACAHAPTSKDCLPGARLVRKGGVESCILGKDTEHGLVRVRDTRTGALLLEERWENGRREGPSRAWHRNGRPSFEGGYHDGGPDGRWLEWYDDGTSESDYQWQETRRTGVWTLYHRGGKPGWRRVFGDDGTLAAETVFGEDGHKSEGLPKAVIGLVMKHERDRLRYCYEKQLARLADLSGKVTVHLEIGATGKVTTADIAQSTLVNAELSACIVEALRGLEFPRPAGGAPVSINYPYLFRPE